MHQALVLPRQAAEQNGGVVPLQLSERQLCRPVEVSDFLARDAGLLLQPLAFGFQALPNQVFRRQDVEQIAVVLRAVLRALNRCSSAHFCRLRCSLVLNGLI